MAPAVKIDGRLPVPVLHEQAPLVLCPQEVNQLAGYIQEMGRQNAQLMLEKNREVNTARQEALEMESRWREAVVRGDHRIGELERVLEGIRRQQEELQQLQLTKESQITAQKEQIQGFHHLTLQADTHVRQLQGEIERLRQRNEELQDRMGSLQVVLDQESRALLALRERWELHLGEIRRIEQEKANQQIQDERRYEHYRSQLRSLKETYDAKVVKVTSLVSVTPVFGGAVGGPFGYFFIGTIGTLGGMYGLYALKGQYTRRVAQLKGPFLELHRRLGKPALHPGVFDLDKHVQL